MEDGSNGYSQHKVTLTGSSADGQLLENERHDDGSRERNSVMMMSETSNGTVLLPAIPLQRHGDAKLPQQGARRPCVVVNRQLPEQLPELDKSTRSMVTTPTRFDNNKTRIEVHSPSPPRSVKKSDNDTDFVVDSLYERRRKRSASVELVVNSRSHFLSVPTDLRRVPWIKSRSVECLGEVPDSIAFAPATHTFPIAADSLPPIQIRSPTLARKAAQYGKGINSTGMEKRGNNHLFEKQEMISSDSIRHSMSAVAASDHQTVMELLRLKRENDQLLSTEASHRGKQCEKTGKS